MYLKVPIDDTLIFQPRMCIRCVSDVQRIAGTGHSHSSAGWTLLHTRVFEVCKVTTRRHRSGIAGIPFSALKRLYLLVGRKHESSRGRSSIEVKRLVTVLDQVAEGLCGWLETQESVDAGLNLTLKIKL